MKKNHWPTLLSLTLLLVANLVGASEVAAQQREQKPDDTVAPKKNACSNTRRATFSVRCKDRYFLGETPTIEIATSNTKRSPQTFKEADNQKYSLELTGLFSNYSVQETKTHVWDGRWDLQQELTHSQPGIILWLSPLRRHPDYVTLAR